MEGKISLQDYIGQRKEQAIQIEEQAKKIREKVNILDNLNILFHRSKSPRR